MINGQGLTWYGRICSSQLDVVIFSDSWSEHLGHLTQVLNSIRSAGLTVRAKKCQLGMDQCCYLGLIVRNESERLKAVEPFLHQKQKKCQDILGTDRILSEVYYFIFHSCLHI